MDDFALRDLAMVLRTGARHVATHIECWLVARDMRKLENGLAHAMREASEKHREASMCSLELVNAKARHASLLTSLSYPSRKY